MVFLSHRHICNIAKVEGWVAVSNIIEVIYKGVPVFAMQDRKLKVIVSREIEVCFFGVIR
jgi:hypothetical protein